MADISAAEVKKLRVQSGAGMMDCKRALVEAGGDFAKAVELLRERGLGKARGKAGRATSDGRVVASVAGDGACGSLIEVNCETDFVARTDDFGGLCENLAASVRSEGPKDVDSFLAQAFEGGTVSDALAEAVLKLGENIQVSRLARLDAGGNGLIGSYIHAGGKIGALAHVQGDASDENVRRYVHNLCMHIAASNPLGVSRDDIDASELESERNVLRKQAEAEGKPANIIEKMVEGRLTKFYKEVVLSEQPLVMDPDKTVGAAAKEAGVTVVAFRRYQLGEEATS